MCKQTPYFWIHVQCKIWVVKENLGVKAPEQTSKCVTHGVQDTWFPSPDSSLITLNVQVRRQSFHMSCCVVEYQRIQLIEIIPSHNGEITVIPQSEYCNKYI